LEALAFLTNLNQVLTDSLGFKFLKDNSSVIQTVNVSYGSVCEAYYDWQYPNDTSAHTVSVQVNYSSPVKHMVEPVTLEVYRDTRLLFWVERDNSSKHTFHGKLVTTTGGVVADQPVKAYLNDTQIAETLTTGSDGCFMFERNFDPTDQKVTYMLKVVYEGTGSTTATLNGTDLEGKPYTVCQTTQFNFKPSSNMSTVVVEPQATQVTVPTKTSEQVEQEAKDSNWCQVKVDYGWWFPFLKIHFHLNLNPGVEFVYAPLIFDLSMTINDEQDFAQKVEDAFDLGYDCCLGILIGKFAAALVARGLGRSSPAALLAAMVAYTGISLTLSYAANANQKDAKTWLIAYLGCVISAGGMFAYKALKFIKWGSAIVGRILDQTYNYWNAWWASGIGWGLITDFFFALIDTFLGCLFLYNYNNRVVV